MPLYDHVINVWKIPATIVNEQTARRLRWWEDNGDEYYQANGQLLYVCRET